MTDRCLGLRTNDPNGEARLSEAEKEVAKLKRALGQAVAQSLRSGLAAGAMKMAMAELESDLVEARRHAARLEAWRQTKLVKHDRVASLMRLADGAQERLGLMSPDERKQVLACLMSGDDHPGGWSGRRRGASGGGPAGSGSAVAWSRSSGSLGTGGGRWRFAVLPGRRDWQGRVVDQHCRWRERHHPCVTLVTDLNRNDELHAQSTRIGARLSRVSTSIRRLVA